MSTNKKTHWKKLHNPNYLGFYSLEEGKDMILTIKNVIKESVKSERGAEDCIVCYFVENAKPMILNVTNSKMIEKIHSTPYIESWSGKQIQIYGTKVKAFGGEVDALRIRPIAPKSSKEELTPNHPSWEKAKNALSLGNTTLEKIMSKYNLSKKNQDEIIKKAS